jgi:hypothetical protein
VHRKLAAEWCGRPRQLSISVSLCLSLPVSVHRLASSFKQHGLATPTYLTQILIQFSLATPSTVGFFSCNNAGLCKILISRTVEGPKSVAVEGVASQSWLEEIMVSVGVIVLEHHLAGSPQSLYILGFQPSFKSLSAAIFRSASLTSISILSRARNILLCR